MDDLDNKNELLKADIEELELTLGPDHDSTLKVKNEYADILFEQEQYQKSERLNQEILEVTERNMGDEHPDTLYMKFKVASCLYHQNHHQKAERLLREVIEVSERNLEPEHPIVMLTKHLFVSLLFVLGRYAEAEQIYREILKVQERVIGPEDPDTLTSKGSLAFCLQLQEKYHEARQIYGEVIKYVKRELGIENAITIATMKNLAICQYNLRQYIDSEQNLREVLILQERVLGPEDRNTLTTKNDLAQCLTDQGQHQLAKRIYEEVLEARERILGPMDVDTLKTKHGLVILLHSQGQNAEAEQICKQVLEARERILGPMDADTLKTKHVLATILLLQGKNQEAKQIFGKVIEDQEQKYGKGNSATLRVLVNDVSFLFLQGRYQDAEQILRDIIEKSKHLQGSELLDLNIVKQNLALCLLYQHKYSEAEIIYREMLTKQEEVLGLEHPDTEESRIAYAHCLIEKEDLHAAAELIRMSGYVSWKQDSPLGEEKMVRRMESLLLAFLRFWKKSNTIPALDVLDKLVSLRIARDLSASFAFVEPSNNEILKAALDAQKTMLSLLGPTNSLGREKPQLSAVDLSRQMKLLSAEMTAAVNKLRDSAPALAGVFFPKWLNEKEVIEVLRPNEVALYLCCGDLGSYGVLISANKTGKMGPLRFSNGKPVTTEKLEKMLEDLRDEVTIRKADDRQLRSELYRAIFSPVLDSIRGKDLVIIPTGPFRVVPYSLLCDVTGTIYLSNLCRYSLTPSLTVLGIIRKAEEFDNPYRDRLLAVAHPVYTIDEAQKLGLDTERSRCVPPTRATFRKNTEEDEIPLPGTKKEVDQIRYLFQLPPDTTVLEQLAATKRRLLDTPWEKYGHFHFACHARAVDDGQGESALVLSRYDEEQAKLGESDSFVTYMDILSRKIPNAVVVLSACDTARGKRMGADLFSLARAFQGAGARAVLATLWRIPDEETPEFVEAFYRRYRSEGKSLREALMETQEEFRLQNKPPHVWAPWVLVGE